MSECNKCNGTLFVCENHPDQEAHQCKHCGGAGMPCECTKISEPIENPEQLAVAWIEHHKGGDNLNWEEVNHHYAKATPLYTHPQKELSDEEIIDLWRKFPNWGNEQHILMFAKELLKKASEK